MVYVAGVDIGSAFSKAVIVESEVVSYHITPSGGNYKLAAGGVIRQALTEANLSFNNIAYIVATGYGATVVTGHNEVVSDISCQGRGIVYIFPKVRTVIDIGGQFSKVSKVDDRGRATAFVQSEKCAGGSGRFLQLMTRVLRIDLNEIGQLSLKSKRKLDFTTGCAVFAETEAISRIAEGALKEDILAGVHRAMAAKVENLVKRVGLEPECALIGGGAKDIGLVRSIEEKLALSLLVPEEPQIVAALGAALIAKEKALLLNPRKREGVKHD